MMEVAKLLATVKLNYSPMNFFGFPEVVIMYPVGKRLYTSITCSAF